MISWDNDMDVILQSYIFLYEFTVLSRPFTILYVFSIDGHGYAKGML